MSLPILVKKTIQKSSDVLTLGLNLTGLRLSRTRSNDNYNKTNYYIRHAGQLIYGKQNIFKGSLALITKEFDKKCTSIDVPSLNIENIDKKYLFYIMSNPKFYESTEKEAVGTGSKRLHEDKLLNLKITVSKDFLEQKKISRLADKTNSLITLHQSYKN
ncbi:hypothetical protein [Metamycoplasma neophronis]|uniref:Type I restriction modification DNA specificity domain-containing protein n=1 Tax=Metamycoplasma neophronis TaxID=872983 RepID=A0ABY2YZV1_9BACT|nr:hypothetical protein [Metamycoplasma neophronis]TPR53202.1 hypothetical protein FJR74_03015 [Metamycoplasma neophronis]